MRACDISLEPSQPPYEQVREENCFACAACPQLTKMCSAHSIKCRKTTILILKPII